MGVTWRLLECFSAFLLLKCPILHAIYIRVVDFQRFLPEGEVLSLHHGTSTPTSDLSTPPSSP